MEIYKILLVDDEEDVIQTIIKKINWRELGFEVVGYASNGIKALELVEEFQPDVIMSDIRMPYMDGIEMVRQIRQEYPETKIIYFTGFDEFEYAKEAVHLEVEEYILKPASSLELTEAFEKLHRKLNQEVLDRQNVEILQQYYMDSLPLLQANFLMSLAEGKIQEEQIEKSLQDYQINMEGPFFACLVIHVSPSHLPDNLSYVLLSASVQKMAVERLQERWKVKSFTYFGDFVLIAQMNEQSEIAAITDDCDRLCRYAKRVLQAVITIGVGAAIGKMSDMSHSYQNAREAVSYRAIFGVERAISSQEILPKSQVGVDLTGTEALESLFQKIRLNELDKIKNAVEQYMKKIYFDGITLEQHNVTVMELVSHIYRFAVANGIDEKEFNLEKTYQRLLGFDPESLKNWIYNISIMFCEQMDRSRSKYSKTFVTKAMDYVAEHYGDEMLSLDQICDYLGVSNAYFSTVFKKETGNSFVAYLTKYRMDKAAKMIEQGAEKNYVIAQKVGYTDPNYFSYVFKRQFGVSPSKYGAQYAKN